MINFVVYRSFSIHGEFHVSDIEILRDAVRRNKENGITGFLRRERSVFIQYIEGNMADLEGLLRALRGDPRHYDLEILARGATPTRSFESWSMGYGTRRGRALAARLGVADLMTDPLPIDQLRAAMLAQAQAENAPRDTIG